MYLLVNSGCVLFVTFETPIFWSLISALTLAALSITVHPVS
jgi:hypothetical protein